MQVALSSRFTLSCLAMLLGILAAGATSASAAAPWTSYRGPTDQGHSNATGLPLHWSETTNVAWKTAIPGKAWSSPVIEDGRIWLTSSTEDGKDLSLLAIDKASGKIVVNKLLCRVAAPQECHVFNSYASPSPALDEGRVYVSFGSPCTACIDARTGSVVWQRTDLVCNHLRGAGSSPLVYGNLMILHLDGCDRQYVIALDKATGKTVWERPRSMDFQDLDPATGKPKLEGDYRKAFSTPLVVQGERGPVLVSLGSMALYGYEPQTGKELWRVESLGSHSGSSRPVAGHGLVFSPMGYIGELWAVRPEGHGVVTDTHVAWRYARSVARRSSPLLVGDWLFSVDAEGVAACLDARSGKELWKARLGSNHSASPLFAEGRIYFFDERGKTTVIEAAAAYRRLAENRLEDGFMASPAVSDKALFLRTRSALYRIEERSSDSR